MAGLSTAIAHADASNVVQTAEVGGQVNSEPVEKVGSLPENLQIVGDGDLDPSEKEIFEVVETPSTKSKVYRCKFCNLEERYYMRNLATHKNSCKPYQDSLISTRSRTKGHSPSHSPPNKSASRTKKAPVKKSLVLSKKRPAAHVEQEEREVEGEEELEVAGATSPEASGSDSGENNNKRSRRASAVSHKEEQHETQVPLTMENLHFDFHEPTPRNKQLQCKYCGRSIRFQKGRAEQHLLGCSEFKKRHQKVKDLLAATARGTNNKGKTKAATSKKKITTIEDASAIEALGMEDFTSLVWLFGSIDKTDFMKIHYRQSFLHFQAPVGRFDNLIAQKLFNLNVKKLFHHAYPSGSLNLLLNNKVMGEIVSQEVHLNSATQAWELYDSGFSVSCGAPQEVFNLIVPPLAKDLGVGFFTADEMHEAVLLCTRPGHVLDWQFHPMDAFVFSLKGETKWHLKTSSVRNPIRGYYPRTKTLEEIENFVKVHTMAVGNAEKCEHPHEDDPDVSTVTTTPGSVLYYPAGTWYKVESSSDAIYMEIHIKHATYADVLVDAVRQSLWKEDKWREGILMGDVGTSRKYLSDLMTEFQAKMDELTATDILPECLVDEHGVMAAEDGQFEKNVNADISHEKYSFYHHAKVLKSTTFRCNPLAVMTHAQLALDFIIRDRDHIPIAVKSMGKGKKRGNNWSIYTLDVMFGDAGFHSKIHSKLRCNSFQAAVIDWIASHGGAAFRFENLLKVAENHRLAPASKYVEYPSHIEESVRYLVRFLSWTGFLSIIKIPGAHMPQPTAPHHAHVHLPQPPVTSTQTHTNKGKARRSKTPEVAAKKTRARAAETVSKEATQTAAPEGEEVPEEMVVEEVQVESEAANSAGGAEEVTTGRAQEPSEPQVEEEEEMDIVEEEETQDISQMPDDTTMAEITQSLVETADDTVPSMFVEEPLEHEKAVGVEAGAA
jgi:hypothetical protein